MLGGPGDPRFTDLVQKNRHKTDVKVRQIRETWLGNGLATSNPDRIAVFVGTRRLGSPPIRPALATSARTPHLGSFPASLTSRPRTDMRILLNGSAPLICPLA